jgi:stage III sporulation protein AF
MIDKISVWAEQIIVAVIIVTLIEMILPNGNNKKYIRTVIGVYILFTIISPVFANKGNLQFNELDYESYFKTDETYTTMSNTLSSNNDKSVEEIYISGLKQDITSKLKEKGFYVEKIEVQIDTQDGENYGSITAINLTLSKIQEEESSNENKITVNTIDKVSVGNTTTNTTSTSNELSDKEVNEIKEYLCSVYEVKEKNIKINGT